MSTIQSLFFRSPAFGLVAYEVWSVQDQNAFLADLSEECAALAEIVGEPVTCSVCQV